MKKMICIVATTIFIGLNGVLATDYTLVADGSYVWDTAPWSPTGIPGEGDQVTIKASDGTQRFFFLNGDQKVARWTRQGEGAQAGGIRLFNGDQGNPFDYRLDVEEDIHIQSPTSFRGNKEGGYLMVYTKNLMLDSSVLLIADGEDYDRVKLKVSGQTVLKGYNAGLVLGEGVTDHTEMELGTLVIDESLRKDTSGITLNHGTIRVHNLRSPSGSAEGSIRGAHGKLVIYGDATDKDAENHFHYRIGGGGDTNDLVVEKTGTNLQIFSNNMNSYSGGTLLKGGILAIRNEEGSGLGTGAVTVEKGGTLAGNGMVVLQNGAYTTVKSGGSIAPGADGIDHPEDAADFHILGFHNYFNKDNENIPLLKMEEGSSFTFRVNSLGESDQIAFGYYNLGGLVLEGEKIAVHLKGTPMDGYIYKLFVFKAGGLKSEGLTESQLMGGLVAGEGFGEYTPTFHYDEEGFGGKGTITMTVDRNR